MLLATNRQVLLVEKDASAARQFGIYLKKNGLTPLGPVTTAADARALYEAVFPPLIILNVQLCGSTDGIDLAYELMAIGAGAAQRQVPAVVFTTNTTDPQTFSRACALRPLAYLEKPYKSASIDHVLQLALANIEPFTNPQLPNPPPMPSMLVPSADPLGSGAGSSRPSGLGCLFVREGGRLVRLDPVSITCVHVEEKYCVIVTSKGRRHSVRVPLADLLRQLALGDFVRIHRSWLINLSHVEYIDPVECVVHLVGGTEAPVGRSFRTDLLQALPLLE